MDYHTLSKTATSWGEQMLPIDQEFELIQIKSKSTPFWERKIQCYSTFHFTNYGDKFGYSRDDVKRILPDNIMYYEPNIIKRKDTWINQLEYAFVISPFGNGLDCHRTWEALILGCIVVVKTSVLDWLYRDLPVLILNEWSDLNTELLENTIVNFKNRIFNYQKLTLEYYMTQIKSIKQASVK